MRKVAAVSAVSVLLSGCVTGGMPYLPPGTLLTPPMGYYQPYGYANSYPDAMRYTPPQPVAIEEPDAVVIESQPVAAQSKRRSRSKGRYRCSELGYNEAQELLSQGHRYLDRDNDGEACESNR